MKNKTVYLMLIFALLFTACGEKQSSGEQETPAVTKAAAETETSVITEAAVEAETSALTKSAAKPETEALTEAAAEPETADAAESAAETETEAVTEAAAKAEESEEEAPTEEATPDFSGESPAKIIYRGKCASLSEISDVKGFFGEPVFPPMSAPSCMGEGEDIVYSYEDFTVTVFAPEGGAEKVVSVISSGSSLGNPRGIVPGIGKEEAIALMGDSYFTDEGVTVSIYADNGTVTEVEYLLQEV